MLIKNLRVQRIGPQKNKKCSWHFHRLKDEVFYLKSGKLLVRYSDKGNIDESKTLITSCFFSPVSSAMLFKTCVLLGGLTAMVFLYCWLWWISLKSS